VSGDADWFMPTPDGYRLVSDIGDEVATGWSRCWDDAEQWPAACSCRCTQ
jgi:hypothetical protein